MFISILIETAHSAKYRAWYHDALEYAIEYDYPIITNAGYTVTPLDTEESRRICALHGLTHISEENRAKTLQYAVPDFILDALCDEAGGLTALELSLLQERNAAFEELLRGFLKDILARYPDEKLEGAFAFGESSASLRYLGKEFGFIIIPYELSAIREDEHCTQSLLCARAEGRLYGSDEEQRRHQKFLNEGAEVPILTRRELIAFFERAENLNLLPLLETEPEYELGLCGVGGGVIPSYFSCHEYVDKDLSVAAYRLFSPEQVCFREHPVLIDPFTALSMPRTPAHFILKCKRIAAIASNTLFTAMLWNRTACCPYNIISLSFMCERDLSSRKRVDIALLNWMLFGGYVPGYENLYSPEYWRWRKSCTSETEIYLRHLDICLGKIGLDRSIFELDEESRLRLILQKRGCDEISIEKVCMSKAPERVNYDALCSFVKIKGADESEHMLWCINAAEEDLLSSSFYIDLKGAKEGFLDFSPLLVGGFAKLVDMRIENGVAEMRDYSLNLLCEFYKPVFNVAIRDATGVCRLTFRWKYKPIGVEQVLDMTQDKVRLTLCQEAVASIRTSLEQTRGSLQQTQGMLTQREAALTETQAALAKTQVILTQREETLNQTQATLSQRETALTETQAALAETQGTLTQREETLNQTQATLSQRENALTETQAALAETQDTLTQREETLNRTQEELASVLSSSSWRYTAVFRQAGDLMKKLLRRN